MRTASATGELPPLRDFRKVEFNFIVIKSLRCYNKAIFNKIIREVLVNEGLYK